MPDGFDISQKAMSEEEYLNMVFSHLEEAIESHHGAHVLRLRTSGPGSGSGSPEVIAQRRALGELAARLLETNREEALGLAFKQYETYLKAKG